MFRLSYRKREDNPIWKNGNVEMNRNTMERVNISKINKSK